jgi:hypothetical protein
MLLGLKMTPYLRLQKKVQNAHVGDMLGQHIPHVAGNWPDKTTTAHFQNNSYTTSATRQPTQSNPQTSSPRCAICPSYGMDSMDYPDTTH